MQDERNCIYCHNFEVCKAKGTILDVTMSYDDMLRYVPLLYNDCLTWHVDPPTLDKWLERRMDGIGKENRGRKSAYGAEMSALYEKYCHPLFWDKCFTEEERQFWNAHCNVCKAKGKHVLHVRRA